MTSGKDEGSHRVRFIAAALLPVLCMAQSAPEQPLEPNGPWTANFEESMCLLSRKFGPQGEVTLSFRPAPLDDYLEILLLTPPKGRGSVLGSAQASIEILPGGQRFDASYSRHRPRVSGSQATFLYSVQDVLTALKDDSLLRLKSGTEMVAVRPGPMRKALSVVADCKRALLAHWGLDLAKLDAIAVPPKPQGERSTWVGPADYPVDALRRGQIGRVSILWTISTDGRARDCKVVASSNVASLDQAACKAIERRARYEPARDKAGGPTESYGSRSVNWLIPG